MRGLQRAYPVLLVLVPPLFIAANNPGEYTPRDLGQILLALVVVFTLLLGALAFLMRRRAPEAAPTILLFVVLWFWLFVPAQRWLRDTISWRLGSTLVLVPIGLLCTVLLWRWLTRRPSRADALTRAMSIMTLLLVGWSGSQVLWTIARLPIEQRSPLVGELARPVRVDTSRLAPGAARRDVYVILMDTYPSARVLREFYGFDNGPFEDSLRALGFVVPPLVRSNFTKTVTSLPSLLNMRVLTELGGEPGAGAEHPIVPYHLIEYNAAARFLKSQGYTYVFHGSAWWRGTAESHLADVQVAMPPDFNLRRQAGRSDLRRQLWRLSLLELVGGPQVNVFEADHVLASFEALAAPPPRRHPVFVFAHFLLPHGPYLFDAECRKRSAPVAELPFGTATDRRLFVEHLQCGNRQLLRAVRAILARSTVPPIIVIQGDHGPLGDSRPADDARMTSQDLRLSFDVFGAYHLPAGGDADFHEPITVANVLRSIFVHYFAADLPRQPDASYLSRPKRPFEFTRVDERRMNEASLASP